MTRPLWHFVLFFAVLFTLLGGAFSSAVTPMELMKSLCAYNLAGFVLAFVLRIIAGVK